MFPVLDVLLPNHECAVLGVSYSDAPLPQHVVLVLVPKHLYHLIAFSLQLLSDRDFFPKLGLCRLVFLKDIAVSDGVEALFDKALSSNPLQPLNHDLLADVVFPGSGG